MTGVTGFRQIWRDIDRKRHLCDEKRHRFITCEETADKHRRERVSNVTEGNEMGDAMKTRLKEVRRDAGMSQRIAAERLGVSLGTYRNWEQGRVVMNGVQLIDAARLFDTNVDHLLMIDGAIEKRMDPSQELVSLFDGMTSEGKHALLVVARGLREAFPRD